jgi:predicted permease
MFSNSTSTQLIYIESLAPLLGKLSNRNAFEAKSIGNVIILLYTIFVNFLRWSIGYNIMKPENEEIDYDNVEIAFRNKDIESTYSENMNNEIITVNKEIINNVELSKMERRNSLNSQMTNSQSTQEIKIEDSDISTSKVIGINTEAEVKKSPEKDFFKLIKEGVNMPFISGLIAILASSTPYFNTQISNRETFLFKIFIGI